LLEFIILSYYCLLVDKKKKRSNSIERLLNSLQRRRPKLLGEHLELVRTRYYYIVYQFL
jgi:hypothetical protein